MCFNLKNMNPLILIFVVFSVLILEKSSFANGQKQKRKKGGKAGAKKSNIANKQQKKMQMAALNAWGDSLTEADYNYQIWGNPANVFHRMSNQLSSVFKLHSASVNFILVGACDGTHDKTISERFIPNSHWRAAFVEAISINVRDLNFFLANRSVADRSFVLHAAATNICYNATIPVQRPRLEEKSLETKKEIAHWMRRQIGGIATKNHLLPKGAQEDRANWLTEDVRCVTGGDVIREWATVLYNEKLAARNILRPHVLKIDAEGHDYEVLMSFVSPDISDAQLPLLIDFEAKSLNENYPKTVELLKSRGYVVSKLENDGFALLRAEKFQRSKKEKINVEEAIGLEEM